MTDARLTASALKLWAKSYSNSIFWVSLTQKNWVLTVHKSNKINTAQLNFSAQNALCLPPLPHFFVVNSPSLFSGAMSDMSKGDTTPFCYFVIAKKNKRDSKIWAQTQLILFEFERRWNSKTMSCAELKIKSLSERQVWLMHTFFKSQFWVFSWYVSAYWSIAFGKMNCLIL